MPKDPDVLDVHEAAEYLGVNAALVYSLLRERRLPGRKVGRSWRLHRRALEQWLSEVDDLSSLDDEDEGLDE